MNFYITSLLCYYSIRYHKRSTFMSTVDNTKREQVIDNLLLEYPIHDIVKFDESNVRDKLEVNAFEVIKYQELFFKEKNELDKITALKDKIIGEQYDYYRFRYDKVLTPAEVKSYYLPKDPKILNINRLLRQQQWRIDFFEMCYKSINSMGWNMKSYLQALKGGL